MNRLVKAIGVAAFSFILGTSAVLAQQQVGSWTLNINNRNGAAPVPAGGFLPYDIRIDNDGNYATPVGKVTFTIPPTTIYRGVNGLADCTPEADGVLLTAPLEVSCVVPPLAAGAEIQAEVIISPMQGVCNGANCVIEFSGNVSNPSGDKPASTSQSRTTTITKGADLELTLSPDEQTIQAGSLAHFFATVRNNGPDASTGSKVVIPLPTGMANPVLPNECSLSSNIITCTVPGTLEVGEDYQFTLAAQITTGSNSTIGLGGRVEAGSPKDANVENNTSSIDLIVTAGTDVLLGKIHSPLGLILIGDEVTFKLTPGFAGVAPLRATIVDTIPDNYSIPSASDITAPAGWSCGILGRKITCEYTAAPGSVYAGPINIVTTAITETGPDGVVNIATISSPNENESAPKDNNTATDLRADIQQPVTDLKAHKSGPPRGLVTVDNKYDFKLSASNKGNKPFADEMTITDHLPAGLTVTAIDAPSDWICSPSTPIVGPQDIVCVTQKYRTNPLAVGGISDTITLEALVTDAGTITNSMTVSFPRYDDEGYAGKDNFLPDNTTSSGVTSADGPNWADIGVVKKVTPASVQAGGEVTFNIEIFNNGPKEATRVQVIDRLNDIVGSAIGGAPDNVLWTVNHGPNASGGICSVKTAGNFGRNLECEFASIQACRKEVDCPTIDVTVRVGSQGVKTNTVNAYSLDIPDNDLTNNESSVNYTVTPLTDVTVTKTSPAAAGSPAGQEILYNLTAKVVDNGLSHAENVTITDTLPAGVIFLRAVPSAGSCTTQPAAGAKVTTSNNQIVCNLGTITNSDQKTVAVYVKPTTAQVGTEVLNSVTVTTSTPETTKDNNDANISIEVLPPQLDLIISKTDDPYDPVEITTPVFYKIAVENAGPSDAYNVKITDTLPTGGFRYPELVDLPVGLTCSPSASGDTRQLPLGGKIVCSMDVLKAGETVEFKLKMESYERGRWTNTATVESDETKAGFESPTANNLDREETTVRTRADISVVKTPSVTAVDLRKEFHWDLVITNHTGTGLDIAEEVTLADTLPVGMILTKIPEFISGGGAGRSCTGAVGDRQINCEFGDMAIGEVIKIRLYTKITDIGAQSASNTATVNTESFDKKPENNTSTGTVTTVRGSSVSGKIFKDYNNNGIVDQTDSGIGNATVTLTGKATHDDFPITITIPVNADGTYSFDNLPPGEYQVSYSIPNAGDYSSEPGDGQAIPGTNPPENGTAAANGKTIIEDIVTVGDYQHVNNNFTLVPLPKVGLGKTVTASAFATDGSYRLNYTIKVRNHSGEPINSIELTDLMNDPSQNYGTAVPAAATLAPGQYKVLNITGVGIAVNTSFDGSSTAELVSGATLAAGATATISFVVQVQPLVPWVGTSTVHKNQADVSAVGAYSGKTTTDKSHNTSTGQDNPQLNTPTTITVTPTRSIALTKTATPVRTSGAAEIGDRIDYSFTVKNTGNIPLIDIVLTDPLPDLQALSPTTIARLEPGQTYSGAITAHYILTQEDLDRGFVENTATVVGQWGINGQTPLTVQDRKTANVPGLSDPKIELVKDIVANNIQNPRTAVGDIVRYSFTVTNTGNTNLKNVTVSDLLAGVTPETSFTIGLMAPGQVVTVYATYAIKQADIDRGHVENTAKASGTYGPTNKPIESAPSTKDVETFQQPGMELTKELVSAEPTNPRAGDILEWRVTVTNTGNVTLSNITPVDELEGVTMTPASLASLPPLAPNNSFSFTARAPILQSWIEAGSVTNVAKATYTDPKGEEGETPPDEVTVDLPNNPAIALKKTGDLTDLSSPPVLGETINYTFTIRNTGNVPLNNITLVDLLNTPDGSINAGDGDIVVELNAADMALLGALTLQPLNAAGTNLAETQASVRGTYILTQDDLDRAYIENEAITTGTSTYTPDTQVEDKSGTDFDNDNPTRNDLERKPEIKLIKSVTIPPEAPVMAGDTVTYGFTIINTGNVTLENIWIDDLVQDVNVIPALPFKWAGPLYPGDENSTTFTATYVLTQDDINRGSFTNTADVYGSSKYGTEPDDVTDRSGTDIENDDPTILDFERLPEISIVKSVLDTEFHEPPAPGDVITYQFVITNTGNVTLTNVVLTDELTGITLESTTIDTLEPGTANAVTITGTYSITQDDIQAGKVVNQASVNGKYTPEPGEEPEDVPAESEEIIVPLDQKPDIAVIKLQDLDATTLTEPAEVGQIIGYVFKVKNTGNMILTDIVLDDPLEGITPNQFTIDELQPGEEREFRATYAIIEDDIDNEQVENQATVKATYEGVDGPDEVDDPSGPEYDEDEPVIVPIIPPDPGLTIVKSGHWNDANGNQYPEPGETIEYTFEITNDGNATLYNVTPSDAGPTFNGKPATNSLSAFTPDPVTLLKEESQIFRATYTLTEEDIINAAGMMDAVLNTAKAVGNLRNLKPYESDPDDAVVTLPAAEPSDLRITKQALLHQVKRGDRVPYVITVENTTARSMGPISIVDMMPSGFRFIEGTATVNEIAVEPVVSGRRLSFNNLTIVGNGTIKIRLDLLVLSSAGPGKHVNIAYVTDRDGGRLTPDAKATVEIMAEPVFDCSDIIGTVFDDINRNGYQDKGEPGLPGVRVATVNGWLITTDKHGRFHVPCAAMPDQRIGSNFIMKLDTRTLPTGYRLTTENPRVVRVTAGKMTTLNFGASISRVVRLDLQGAAFKPDSTELQPQWEAGLGQLIEVLKQEPSVLRMSFTGPKADDKLAVKRVKVLRDHIAELWKKNGASYELEIETRVEAGQ